MKYKNNVISVKIPHKYHLNENYTNGIKISQKYNSEDNIQKIKDRIKPLDLGDKIIELDTFLRDNIEIENNIISKTQNIPEYARVHPKEGEISTILKLPAGEVLSIKQAKKYIQEYVELYTIHVALIQIDQFIRKELKFWEDKTKYKIFNNSKIQWHGIHEELIELFKFLNKERKLSPKQAANLWALIASHFENPDGTPITNKTLGQEDSRSRSRKDDIKKKPNVFIEALKNIRLNHPA